MQVYNLSNETIEKICEDLGTTYESCGKERREVIKAKLILEEALLKYQARFGSEIELYYRSYRILSQTRFVIRVDAPEFDPFTLEENPMAFMLRSLLSGMEGSVPSWTFKNAENEITFVIKKAKDDNALAKVGFTIAASLVLGIVSRLIFGEAAIAGFTENYLEPISDAYAGLFCVMAPLLTFFAISLSIVHLGDISVIGSFGGKIIRRFYVLLAAIVLIFTIPVLPFVKIGTSGEVQVAIKSLYDILISFIPSNLVSPFLNFNSVHLIILGGMFGFAFLSMGQKCENTVNIFKECNLVAIITNGFLNRFIYLYAGLKAFKVASSSDFESLADAGKLVLAILAADVLLFVFYLFRASKKSGKTPMQFFKEMIPGILICMSSANFGAAVSTVIDSLMAEKVDDDILSLALNLGSIIYQPACTVVFVLSSIFMASSYDVAISPIWLVMSVVLSILLVGAMPNMPGAAITALTLLYSQLGLPADAISLMLAVNAILQFITVGIDAWCLECEIICLSVDMKC